MKTIKVLIADDHEIMRMGLAALLETDPGIEIAGEAADGTEAVRKALKFRPDVVIMDLMMPVKDGETATAEIKRELPETKILVLTTFGTSDGIAHALKAGAEGALLKSTANTEILRAVKKIAAGGRAISDEIRELMTTEPPVPALTDRQLVLLGYVVGGLPNKTIAEKLGITEDGVKHSLSAIFSKIGAESRAEAVAIALRKHLLKN